MNFVYFSLLIELIVFAALLSPFYTFFIELLSVSVISYGLIVVFIPFLFRWIVILKKIYVILKNMKSIG